MASNARYLEETEKYINVLIKRCCNVPNHERQLSNAISNTQKTKKNIKKTKSKKEKRYKEKQRKKDIIKQMRTPLIACILLAATLRLPYLNIHIPALYGDEIAIGYNAYAILTTGKDEFGRWFPLQFESWGDQKNPIYIYIVALLQTIFGLSPWSVRLPSALAGITAVYLTYALTKTLLEQEEKTKKYAKQVALFAAILLAINPWHIHISRAGFEANLALTLGVYGALQLLNYQKTKSKKAFLFSVGAMTLAMYTYYTTKMFIPLLIIVLWLYAKKYETSTKDWLKSAVKYGLIFILMCTPIAYLAIFENGQARFQTINIFNQASVEGRVVSSRNMYTQHPRLAKLLENKATYITRDLLEYYFENVSGQFWFVAGDSSLRYAIGNHGMFYLIDAPFLLIGCILLFKHNHRLWFLLMTWLLLAPLPTALVGRAYGLRSLAILPIPMIFTAYGIVHLAMRLQKTKLRKALMMIVVTAYAVSSTNWLLRYAYFYPIYGQYWYDGMQKQMIEYAKQNEDKYDHIILSRWYGKTEMYYAFYAKIPPAEYQKKAYKKSEIANTEMVQLGKYYFGDINPKGKPFEQLNLPSSTLLIASPNFDFATETINAKDDGRILFKVVKQK